ncbi:hypothetical protein MKY59_21265 [Paenibacillus sp. FSL W8-0426]|uniref:hypothetical protein n=1 Tax=Paenibacillus sp. FSL W8-0426 TaxID=2921714 RepID=UPI0030D9039D
MQIGAKIYYEKDTGNVIQTVGERSGEVIETTREQDFAVYAALADRVPDTVGMIQLEYGAHAADYAEGGVFTRVDLTTLEPLFTYPDPSAPETPQEPQPALSTKVSTLESESTATQAALASTYEALIQSQQETTSAQMALADVYEQLINMRSELDALKGGDV